MAKSRSDKSTYPSRYSPNGWVTPAQYIIEFICEKKAKSEGKELPTRFWRLKDWEKEFKRQLRRAHALLKKYDSRAIVRALKNSRANRIYSLYAPHLESIIQTEQAALDLAEQSLQANKPHPTPQVKTVNIRKPMPSKHILDILKEVDE